MNSIPTLYAGTQFRSRLKAKWAAFFDLCKWEWTYEPFDLNGYIPDFVLRFYKPVIVEVKPELKLQQFEAKIDASGWTDEALIVGYDFVKSDESWFWQIGRLRENAWDIANFHMCGQCGKLSFHHSTEWWGCRVCGKYEGDQDCGVGYDPTKLFREAGNRVQWRAEK